MIEAKAPAGQVPAGAFFSLTAKIWAYFINMGWKGNPDPELDV
jgi:hypothetical protein